MRRAGRRGPGWYFEMKSTDGWLAAEPPHTQRLPIELVSARGLLAPEQGRIVLSQFALRAGGAEVTAQGDVANVGGTAKGHLEAKIGPMSAAVFKTVWPGWVAPHARTWVVQRLARGNILGGAFKLVRGVGPPGSDRAPMGSGDRVSFTLEGTNLELHLVKEWPALEMPRGLLRVENRSVEFTAPEGSMTASDGRKLALKGTFSVDLDAPLPHPGRLALRGQGPLTLALEMLDQKRATRPAGRRHHAGGHRRQDRHQRQCSVAIDAAVPAARQRGRGAAARDDGRMRNVWGSYDAQGVNLDVDLTPAAFEAKGKFLVGTCRPRLTWQHVYDAPADKQPPLRIAGDARTRPSAPSSASTSTTWCAARSASRSPSTQDARASGTSICVPIWRTPSCFWKAWAGASRSGPSRAVRVRSSPRAPPAIPSSCATSGWTARTSRSPAGWALGEDMRVTEYRFPQFSLDVVSNFEAHGKLRADNVWEVTAKGPDFDGRDLFKSFFFVLAREAGQGAPGSRPARRVRHGGRLLRDLRARRAADHAEARQQAEPARHARRPAPAASSWRRSCAPSRAGRVLMVAKSNDAGQVFKLVGFLPHAVGGDMSLEVNIDGKGAAERTGVLTATRFYAAWRCRLRARARPVSGGRRRNVVREKIRVRQPARAVLGRAPASSC